MSGDTLERSWSVLKPGGRMMTIAADSEGTDDQRVRDAFFIVELNQKQLVEIAKQLDAGQLRAFVKTTVPLNEASAAYSGAMTHNSGQGKIVIAVSLTDRRTTDLFAHVRRASAFGRTEFAGRSS